MKYGLKCWLLGLGLAGAALSGCASAAGDALARARSELAYAGNGGLELRAPLAVEQARRALREAERVGHESGDHVVVQDLAYVALRRIELARVEARIEDELVAQPDHEGAATRSTAPQSEPGR